MKIKRMIASALMAIGLVFATAGISQAACSYYPPTGSNEQHVHYYNCQGPYRVSYSPPYYRYYCYADWDSYAEWFWGKHDGPVWVWAVQRCYA